MDSADLAHTVTQVRTADKRKVDRMYNYVRKFTETKNKKILPV
jgi:hypothetical protein